MAKLGTKHVTFEERLEHVFDPEMMVFDAAIENLWDIDKGHDSGGTYLYPWRPKTGRLMYCKPKVGTRVSLYFPGFDEKDAFVVNCIRTNGASCEKMRDPSKRSFTTEHGKELNLFPE